MTAGSGRLRKEKTIVQYTIAGKPAQAPGTRIIYTLNKQSFVEHMPERKFAMVHEGSGDRPWQQQTQLGLPNVLHGGNPVTVPPHWTSKQIVSSEAVETAEGKATKLVMAEPGAAGIGTTIAIWILPAKGYSVFRSESYMHGKLRGVRQYGGYKEIEAGQWYPFNQKVEHIDAVLPPDVEQKLKSGELSITSEQVLKSQIVQRSRGGELALESVKINGPIDEQQFSITMPTGTAVSDYVLGRSPGMPYEYVVGPGTQSVQIEPIERASSAQALAGSGAMTFGPEGKGLRAAVELISSHGVFALGEPIEVLFHIRNTSSTNIYVAGGSWRQDEAFYITIEDQQGRQIPAQHIYHSVRTPIQRNLLLPGESAVFHSSGLAFLAKDADGKQVTQPVGNYVKVTPGRYTVRYRLHFPDLERTGFPESSDWQGDLDTAPVTVEVTAANKSAAAPAFGPVIERVLDFDTSRQAAYLNLDTGEYVDPGTNATNSLLSMKATPAGVDLRSSSVESNFDVRWGINLAVVPVEPMRWEATAEEIRLALGSVERHPEIRLGGGRSTNTWFFQTSEGGRGVLQFLPPKAGDDPSQVRLRYRLVQPASPSGSSTVKPKATTEQVIVEDLAGEAVRRFQSRNQTNKPMKTTFTVLLTVAVALLAHGRPFRAWSFQELTDQADLVVIAKPISTTNTTEHSVLPNTGSPGVRVVGVNTEFEVLVALKGDKSLKTLVLHHCRLANPEEHLVNGPSLVSFDPKQPNRFLLFLHKDPDGRYSPVSGQTDASSVSVYKLEGPHGEPPSHAGSPLCCRRPEAKRHVAFQNEQRP